MHEQHRLFSPESSTDSGIKQRDEINPRHTWKLDDIYSSWEDWEQDCATLKTNVDSLAALKGTLADDPKNLRRFLKISDDSGQLFDRVWYYPGLAFDLDQRNNEINANKQRVEDLSAQFATATSWFEPELLAVGLESVQSWMESDENLALYRFHLEEIFRQAEHVLDEQGEHLMALSSRFGGTPSQTYSMLTTADADFPDVTLSDGSTRKITPGAYGSLLRTLPKQEDRETVFRAHFGLYEKFSNTYAAIYNGILQRGWFSARARGYENVLEAKLHRNAIPSSVVHTLVGASRDGMDPLRRYHKLRKQALKVDKYFLYDGFASLVEDRKRYTYDEAEEFISSSVAPLGAEYQQRVRDAFERRWVDVYETDGKRSGGYMAGVYGVHPFILMNFHGTLDDVFTLAHEMGHAMHSVLSNETQPYTYHQYTIFIAEVASTLNEALLLDQMLANAESPAEKVALLQHAIDSIAGTFYTQSMFANYELEAHKLAEAGQPITGDVLSDVYHGLLKTWYGDAIEEEELYRMTWARIPHFFHSPYYVYQYATSFAASSAIFNSMKQADSDDSRVAIVERYLTLLRSGGSDHPMELLKQAGVDLNQPDAVNAVVQRLDSLVSQLEEALQLLA